MVKESLDFGIQKSTEITQNEAGHDVIENIPINENSRQRAIGTDICRLMNKL